MLHHVETLIAEGEHQTLDFKFEIADAHKIARTLSAFANTDGGRLLVGVKDNGVIAGIRSDEEYYMVESAAQLYCKPPVGFSVKEWTLRKKTVLEVVIRKSADRPHYARQEDGTWKAYHRVKDQNFPANRILLSVWKLENAPRGVYLRFSEPEKLILQHLENHESITLQEYARLAGIPRSKAERILVRFILLKMLKMNFTENGTFFTLHPRAAQENNP